MSNDVIDTFFICLLTSMVWAPIIFLVASRLARNQPDGIDDKIWPAALVVAALPVFFAPIAATLGLSLRTPAPLPPMADAAPIAAFTPTPAPLVIAPETPLTLAQIPEAAALLYFYGFILFLILGAVRMAHFSYRVRYAYELDEPKLEAGLEDWRQRMGIKRQPRYAFTDAISSVCVHGVFRPSILMPEHLLDRVSIDDAILMGAHEMAHIKRGDTALFALCTMVKSVFWFNPFTQRIAARANLAAEQAADALVISRGVDRREYAHCFVQGLRFAANQHHGAQHLGRELVPSFTPFDKRSRRQRLDAILSGNGGALFISLPSKIGLGLSIVAAGALAFAQAALAVAPRPAQDALPIAPVKGEVTMPFGQKSELLGKGRPAHEGVDIKAKRGTLVRAAGAGKVIDATKRYRGQRAWGKVVVIDHGHGLVTRYAHLDSYAVVKGDRVSAGDVIGAVGSTGKSTGPHLHFEVIQDGLAIDPAPVIAAEPMPAPQPVAAPAPVIKTSRSIQLTPMPEIAEVPEAPEATVAPEAPLGERLNERLAGRFENFEARMAEAFEDFDGFDGFTFEFGDMELDGFDGAEELTDKMKSQKFHFDGFVMPDITAMVSDFHNLTEEDLDGIRRAQENALRQAAKTMERAERAREQTHERAEHDREKAIEHAERNRERALERAELDRERAERDRERARDHAERQRERAHERAERDRERHHDHLDKQIEFDEDMLRMREEAIRDAQQALDEERTELEQIRAALERKKRNRQGN